MESSVDRPILPFQTIVFATDFSACSLNAGSYAALLARRFAADLVVAHAFLPSGPAMEAEAETGSMVKSWQRKDQEAALGAAAATFGQGLERTTTVLLEGDPREAIPRLTHDYVQPLVVLGTEGRSQMARGILGSVAERILRASEGPCLTVGPQVPVCEPLGCSFRRMLFATGLSRAAARGAAYAAAMAQAFGAELEVLHVVHPEDVTQPGGLDGILEHFEAALAEMVPHQAASLLKPKAVVDVGSAQECIPKHLRASKADLLVLSLRKSSHLWLQSRLSRAFQIVANSPCPVLTITG